MCTGEETLIYIGFSTELSGLRVLKYIPANKGGTTVLINRKGKRIALQQHGWNWRALC